MILMIIDVQNDFCEGGSLEVQGSLDIIEKINTYRDQFDNVIITKDWHLLGHVSFAETHGQQAFSSIQISNKTQELWPVHCVQGSFGAELHPKLKVLPSDHIFTKGTLIQQDSYSAFGSEEEHNGLRELLEYLNAQEIFIVGLALDYCVMHSAIDALKYGYKVHIVTEMTRAVFPETARERVIQFAKLHGNFTNFKLI